MPNTSPVYVAAIILNGNADMIAFTTYEAAQDAVHSYVSSNWDEDTHGTMPEDKAEAIDTYFDWDGEESYEIRSLEILDNPKFGWVPFT